ncbi:NAD(P)H-binding protein [Arthrobacter zhangbolii]|uniref:NAD(P)H-binding protein n=1 Tax=Arthrobacter zhangbolii TaxID=2886936 RepID=A0A9X1M8P9_9MICC|nr:NAD(P)H-binding protein [Arthrobacter zhangbolii]MCC3273528.1 NAD(P)H-binding protein [Arthrobacter zhangbolii]UON92341.1 NAD(P)H-binding protein [Arthrobacter zhangbolii]
MRILVTGATGQVGRHLVSQLHESGHTVRALTRNPAKADLPAGVEAVAGDLTGITSLRSAFEGIDAIHLITFGGDDGEDLTNGAEIVRLAERSGISRATVLGGWSPTSIEGALKASSISWTIVQPAEFMGNALDLAPEVRASRTVSMLANYPSAVVHEADIAAVAATALTSDGHGGKAYPLTGPEALTTAQRTQLLAESTGEPIRFVQLSEEAERERLRGYGYDEDYVEFGIQLAANPPAAAGTVLPTIEEVTGRSPRTFAQWAREHANQFRAVS